MYPKNHSTVAKVTWLWAMCAMVSSACRPLPARRFTKPYLFPRSPLLQTSATSIVKRFNHTVAGEEIAIVSRRCRGFRILDGHRCERRIKVRSDADETKLYCPFHRKKHTAQVKDSAVPAIVQFEQAGGEIGGEEEHQQDGSETALVKEDAETVEKDKRVRPIYDCWSQLFPSFPPQSEVTHHNLETLDWTIDKLPKCPLSHRVERLILWELASIYRKAGFRCPHCNKMHHEWIRVARFRKPNGKIATDRDVWNMRVRPVVLRWIQYGVAASATHMAHQQIKQLDTAIPEDAVVRDSDASQTMELKE
ncbi:hypothetical protein DFQ28_000991 [Apophysomyces sp. BC1034]|nr:hypothetical protein DFQ30_002605 [Apophysomyces sp. BC1015]KAG0178303.1 hypothetical protein DFQ29_003655 [Apophysomyces sp. BC1021]KAG0191093.1 hypothetical protein DFQ28_000991 [Apophysomyces sp. BC1034]